MRKDRTPVFTAVGIEYKPFFPGCGQPTCPASESRRRKRAPEPAERAENAAFREWFAVRILSAVSHARGKNRGFRAAVPQADGFRSPFGPDIVRFDKKTPNFFAFRAKRFASFY